MNSKRTYRKLVVLLILLLTCGGPVTRAQLFLVPGTGNGDWQLPLFIENQLLPSQRYQQVYSSAYFADIFHSNKVFIASLYFGYAATATAAGGSITNIQINLSTTPKAVDGLSTNFAENVGIDDTVVFSGPLSREPMLDVPPYGDPFNGKNICVPLLAPFLYDPLAGNLLMDIRNYTGGPRVFPGTPYLVAAGVLGDAVSCAYGDPVTVTSGTTNTGGVVTGFWISQIPQLKIAATATNVVVDWTFEEVGFELQSASSLAPTSNWQRVQQTVVTNWPFKEVTLPPATNSQATFFRVIWPPP